MKGTWGLAAFFVFLGFMASKSEASNSYVSGRGLYLLSEAAGEQYSAKSATLSGVEGDFTYGMSSRWGLRAGGGLSFGGEFLSLRTGMVYHFVPVVFESIVIGQDATVSRYPLWVPYMGASLGLVRAQVPLVRKDGSQSDIVLGGLVGPAINGGILYSLSQVMYAHADLCIHQGFGPNLQVSLTSITFGLALVLK